LITVRVLQDNLHPPEEGRKEDDCASRDDMEIMFCCTCAGGDAAEQLVGLHVLDYAMRLG